MRAAYYNEIKTALNTISEFKHVGRWKNQLEANAINATPCVFIEIEPITYDSDTAKQQSANSVSFILHLIVQKYSTEDSYDDQIYTLSQKIFNLLQNTQNFERQAEALDVSYEKYEDFQLTYLITRLVDQDAMKSYTEIDTPTADFDNLMKEPDGS